jgi:GT2 family glycosyltransferase/glycosyltransferase involved in cell wall biosynthesis
MPHPASVDAPLVSVVMPAWKARFLNAALASLREQSYRNIELVVCDDSRMDHVRKRVEAFAVSVDFPVRYAHNPERLFESRNAARGVQLARGEYVKFLYDDDLLDPRCIELQLAAIHGHDDIALVSSRRRRVDAGGIKLHDTAQTARLFSSDVRIDGPELVGFLGQHPVNFIGEPSAVMCRRADLLEFGPRLMDLGGVPIQWIGDLALYAKLLRKGDLAYLDTVLSSFRVSEHQFSQIGRDRPGIGDGARETFQGMLRALGWCGDDADHLTVGVAPLHDRAAPRRFDLRQALATAEHVASEHYQRLQWCKPRQWLEAQHSLADRHLADAGQVRLGVLIDARGSAADAALETLDSLQIPAPGLQLSLLLLGAAPTGRLLEHPSAARLNACADLDAALEVFAAEDDDAWLIRVEAGATFCPGGLQRLLVELASAPAELGALYADAWYRDAAGRLTPVMRPDLNLDLLLGNPTLLSGHWVLRRQAVKEVGGFDPTHAGAMELDLILRMIQHQGLGGIGHLAEPLLTCAPPRFDAGAQQAAILRHLHARGYADAQVEHIGSGQYRVDYAHGRQPAVSIVIVAPATLAALERCVVSVLEQTRYPNYELLLIDNGAPQDVGRWIQQVESLGAGRVRAFSLEPPLARSAACNVAAGQAAGEFVVFLRPETAIVQPQWLDGLLNHALRPEVGIVGPRTVSAEGTVTHAGLIPALLESGGRAFAGLPIDAAGYMGRLRVAQDYSAVSDGCLMIRAALLDELGGFDDLAFADAGADVDLCLRAAALGLLTVWTPESTLLHAIEPTPLPDSTQEALFGRWLPRLAHDPAYNRNLDLGAAGFALGRSELSWDPLPWRPLPRVLAVQSDITGAGLYRIAQPFDALLQAGLIDGARSTHLPDVVEAARLDPDVLVVQRRMLAPAVRTLDRLQRHSRAFKVYELDDYLPSLPLKSIHRQDMPADVAQMLRAALRHMDRFVVSTPRLAEALADYHPDIRVVENRLDPGIWRRLPTPLRRVAAKPRVGWAGGVSHTGDLEMIADVVRKLADEVTWVFFGLCPERLRPYVHEFRPGVDIARYPTLLAKLNLDLALAPLEQNLFNACKSNLRLLEYGACGYPVVCSDLAPYRGALPVTRVKNRTYDWVQAIRAHLADPAASAAAGDALRDAVRRDWMLEGENLLSWRQAWLPD